MSSFFIVLDQLVQFFFLLMLGYLLASTHMIQKEELGILSKLVIQFFLPAYSFGAIYKGATKEQLASAALLFPLGLLVFATLALLTRYLAKWLHIEEKKSSMFQASFLFGNTGFIGIPILKNLYGAKGVIYMSMYSIPESIILWTYGLRLLHGDKKEKFRMRNLLNPNIVVVFFGIFLIIADITLPEMLINTVKTVGAANVPVCMIYLGAMLYFSEFHSALKRKEVYIGVAFKMVLFPLAVGCMIKGLPLQDAMKGTIVIICALPTMTIVPILAGSGGRDGSYAMGTAMATLVFSLVTLPIVTYLAL